MKVNFFSMFAAVAAATLISGNAMAQKPGKHNSHGHRGARPSVSKQTGQLARPIRWAPIDKYGRQIGPWVSIVGDNDWPNGPWTTVFDCAEISPVTGTAPNGAPWEDPAYGPIYLGTGARYFFGPTYENTFTTNDMEVNPLYSGFDANRLAIGWYWNPVGGPGTENCVININNAEVFADTAAGLPAPSGPNNISWGGAFDGVSLDFGFLATQPAGGAFYFANVDLDTATPIPMPLPQDGKGAYVISLRNGPTTLASVAQMMLWVTKQTNYGLPGGNPSFQGGLQWDDDGGTVGPNNSDAIHQTDPPGPANVVELYDYTGLVPTIPEPLGAMYSLYSNFGAFTAANNAALTVDAGSYFGGTAASVRVAGDNNSYFVLCDEFDTNGILRMVVDTTATTTTAMSVIGATKASRNDLSEFWQFKNTSNAWITTGVRLAPFGSFGSKRIDTDAAAAPTFIDANGGVQFRLSWIPQTDIDAGDGWTMEVDRLTVFVKGTDD